ncbi:MAG: ABC transporter permease [Planctomycetota bacterium]|jgi:ABC-type transport system involved in multi-copper enzyme maturation permease subunit
MNAKVLFSVFKRNFVAYFANPTGYLFICVFVLLSTVAAFWPDEFFTTNLANLDQLSFSPANPFGSFPFIMLVFIPTITMGVWADERRRGTDELLLTIPASDLDIVLGKYLAAVTIYSVALVFSAVSNLMILEFLGDPDTGLFIGTYVGYWLVGLAMLAIGMVASFLTSDLTIAYIFGAILNVPLVFAVFADSVAGGAVARAIKEWSVTEQFRDFGRGIVSLSGLVYFGMIVAVMLYLSMVLIGRRHWREGQGRLPNHVFYPLLHLGWFASFVTFWIVLKQWFDPTNVFIMLSVMYLLLHAGLLWGWSALRGQSRGQPMDALVALIHLAVIGGFVGAALGLKERFESLTWLIIAFAVYGVIHVGLWFAWLRFAGHAALLPGQYTVRALALVAVTISAVVLFTQHDRRWDVTEEKLSSLSPDTIDLLKSLKPDRPIQIDAFISPEPPETYVQPRLNLISALEEIKDRAGGKIDVRIYPTEQFRPG